MKVLDIVKTKEGLLAMITHVLAAHDGNPAECSIEYIKGQNSHEAKNAWFEKEELEIIDSVGRIINRSTG